MNTPSQCVAVQRQSLEPVTVGIIINKAITTTVDARGASGGIIITPALWTDAKMAFKVCSTSGGTFVPLRSASGAIVEITGVVVDASGAYPLPAELFGAPYFQIWSENGGSDVNQAAARSLVVALKG